MAHYYLNIRNSMGFVRDEEGDDFPDLQAAREKAAEGVRSILSEEVKKGIVDLRGLIELRVDQRGRPEA
jgi:hypothetical protein